MRKSKKISLRKKADAIFSKYIRQRDGGKCYTCKNENSWKRMQCGHFVPRQYLSVRYDPINCHTQCYACNMLYNGQPSMYAMRLEKDYGAGTVAGLERRRLEICHDFNYQAIIDLYTGLCVANNYEC